MTATQSGLTVLDLVQLYAPLAGLLVVVFWLGRISEKVQQLTKQSDKDQTRFETIEGDIEICRNDGGGAAMMERMIKVEIGLENLGVSSERQGRTLEGIQRTLANMTSGKGGFTIIPMSDEHG